MREIIFDGPFWVESWSSGRITGFIEPRACAGDNGVAKMTEPITGTIAHPDNQTERVRAPSDPALSWAIHYLNCHGVEHAWWVHVAGTGRWILTVKD